MMQVLMVTAMASFVWIAACLPMAAGTVGQQSLFRAVHASSSLAVVSSEDYTVHHEGTCSLPSIHYADHLDYASVCRATSLTGANDGHYAAISMENASARYATSTFARAATDTGEACAPPYSLTGVSQALSCSWDDSFQSRQPMSDTKASGTALPAGPTGSQSRPTPVGLAVLKSVAVGIGVTACLAAGLPTWLQYV